MEDLRKSIEELKSYQQTALKIGDMATLNTINQKLFELREQVRKIKQKQKEQHIDDITAIKIENILTK